MNNFIAIAIFYGSVGKKEILGSTVKKDFFFFSNNRFIIKDRNLKLFVCISNLNEKHDSIKM